MCAQAKPLGEHGAFWLRVHLANLYGHDKLPLDERAAWAEAELASGAVEAAASDPLSSGFGWWSKAEKPLQTLATATELLGLLQHERRGELARDYAARVPVHVDGSCNGLQHYAALALDDYGGEQVSLAPQP